MEPDGGAGWPGAADVPGARVLLPLLAALVGVAVTVSLGNWQLRRAQEKLALQAAWDQAERAPPLAVGADDVAAVGAKLPLRVRLTGRFLHPQSIWLVNRQMDGQSGFNLITPLQLDGGAIVLVNRGFAARDPQDRLRLPPVEQPPHVVTVEGLALPQASQVLQLGAPGPEPGQPALWQNLDFDTYEQASRLRVARWVLQQTDGAEDGLQRNWPRHSAGVDKHRGYALQWFGLAALIAVLTLIFGLRAWRRPRGIPESDR